VPGCAGEAPWGMSAPPVGEAKVGATSDSSIEVQDLKRLLVPILWEAFFYLVFYLLV